MTILTPMVKKLKGLTVKDEHLATAHARQKMQRELVLFGADCDGQWQGTYLEIMDILYNHFPSRYFATQSNLRELEATFNIKNWHTAYVQFVYTYDSYHKDQRTGTAFSQVIVGDLMDGRWIRLIFYRGASNQGGQRQFKVEGHRKTPMNDIFNFQLKPNV